MAMQQPHRVSCACPVAAVLCRRLQELSIKDNFSTNWESVLAVVPSCKVSSAKPRPALLSASHSCC